MLTLYFSVVEGLGHTLGPSAYSGVGGVVGGVGGGLSIYSAAAAAMPPPSSVMSTVGPMATNANSPYLLPNVNPSKLTCITVPFAQFKPNINSINSINSNLFY